MRACEGCRRRKIKCDAATTNSWPCAACVRLKLQCVPPSLNYDRVHGGGGSFSGLEGVLDFDHSSASGEDEHYGSYGDASQFYDYGDPTASVQHPQAAYGHDLGGFAAPTNVERHQTPQDFSYSAVTSMPMTLPESYQHPTAFQSVEQVHPQPSPNSNAWTQDQCSPADLSEVMGELSIKENGVATYISQQKQSLAEAPALEEFEVKLSPSVTGSGSTVRIPQDLMPPEETCLAWFETFFTHIHPYVPVLSKPYFYRQWKTNRESISPLILEAMFACAGRMSDDPSQGARWLALASQHEDCFMDVPRLSTIQALLLLLKAREAAPKRGYYYRPGVDPSDYAISRQFLFFVRNVKNVRHLHEVYGKLKKQPNWASDPKFTSLNPEALSWIGNLPKDLQVEYPKGDAPPWLPNHFVGNIHSYYHLNVIMVYRPQLMASDSFHAGGSWKKHMEVCYDSAKKMCRLQEAILQTFGLSGLLCMQRGINFVIYSVLTCAMIHLVAITSPDPDFNKDAKEYFTRHMRLLESCTSAWPMPEMQASIDALREAFSADTNQPFRLRKNFPYGSPKAALGHNEPAEPKYHPNLDPRSSHDQAAQFHYSQPLTPPMTAGLDASNSGSVNLGMLSNGHQQGLQLDDGGFDQIEWNPTRIFEYVHNTLFWDGGTD
ncbi:MAG: hypothetical protein LQ350_004209 [Teloschistes chrysophthalmus]|nr:MAG: hypothetical protein LQ350_004209 [Niorma chrysophthalma]